MAVSLVSGRIQATFSAEIQNELGGADDPETKVTHEASKVFRPATGTTTGKFDRAWGDNTRTLASGASETIDVFDFAGVDIGAGAGLDGLGQALEAAGIVGIYVENTTDSDENLFVGGDGTTAAWNSMFAGDDDAKLVLKPGDFFVFGSPVADPALDVTDTDNHLLKFEAAGGESTGCVYKVHLAIRSA